MPYPHHRHAPRTPVLLLALAAPLLPVRAAESLPEPGFGSDISLGVGMGSLMGQWPDLVPHSWLGCRYDAFALPMNRKGPRLGASIFATSTFGLLPSATEDESDVSSTVTFSYTHYGLLSSLRFDPELPWTGLVSFGFGRMDISSYWGAPYAVPVLTFEAGARHRLRNRKPRPFLDILARASWGSIIAPSAYDGLDELWLLQLSTWVGFHAR